ncbi:adenomatous polyposis coli protein-like [Panonychus citri]|uniref:adenomatous polyposis coli protein-like n=1 Tax=Panonychus citri TaxID=50023 RepID=UPI002307CD73|nr:adenomatous polyposis coli protein-like [Panonychus citri]XP_053205453.1 adenomatous polyposis coli protein-like [Panonychus citri]XP_053205460.1 adenomatous polyposis coli protein-like [Panonychus citri]XP_053205464.1 adenomatous polyposis coli protein-like [Panonychus citri]XP_053205471.1 adenomatous polyposis coli protein-like [Panonychus citri]
MMNSLNQSTLSFGSNLSSSKGGGGGGDDELDTCSIISFGSHRSSNNKFNSNVYKNQQQLEIKAETVYSLLSMLTCNNVKEEMCNKFYSMSLDKRISLEMRSHGCIPLLIQLIHPIGEDTKHHEDNWDDVNLNSEKDDDDNDYGRFGDNSNDGENSEFGCASSLDLEEDNLKELDIRNKACIALRNIIRYSEDTKAGKKEMRVLQLLEEIRGFCDKFKRGNGDLSVSMAHPGEATSQLMKISFDEEHRIAICLLGGLHAIAELIFFDNKYHGNTTSPQCITVRRYAFMALTNLTFGDGTNKSILCSNKLVIRSVIEQLYSPSEELRQVTASVLRNLSWKADDQGKDTLRDMGAVRLLMRAALEARKESTLKSILTALWNLSAHSTTNKAEICAVEGALKFLVSTLNYQSPNNTMIIIENGGGILRNVSSYIARHEHLRAILREHDTLSILLEQLESPSLTIVSNACATLWNLSARCIQDQMKLIELGAIPMLRNLINSKHKMISMGSAAALKNLSSVKNYHEMIDSNCFSSSSRNSSCNSPSTTNTTSASTTPTLLARKYNGFRPELDDSLSETCDNLESPKSSPAHVRRFHPPPPITRYDLPDRMYTSFTVPTLSNPYPYMSKSSSKDSLGSTHSEPVYYPFNNRSLNQQSTLTTNNSQPHLEPALPRSSFHGFNPPPPPPSPSTSTINFANDLSHLFHAYPIKVSDVKENDNISTVTVPTTLINQNSDLFDKKILESARRNVENLLSSPNGQYLSSCINSHQFGVKFTNNENTIIGIKPNERLLPRRKSSTDGTEIESQLFRSAHPDEPLNYRQNDSTHMLSNLSEDNLTKFTHRLNYNCCKHETQNENDLSSSQCNLIDFSPSNVTKKVKSEDTIVEENEENLVKEENQMINSNEKSLLDDELLSTSTLNRSISSTTNNQSINFGENCVTSMEATPIMFSRTSSLGSISGLEIKSIGTSISSVPSEFSKFTSDPISPTDLPDSPTQTEPTTIISGEIETHYNVKPSQHSSSNPLSSENIHYFGQTRMIFEKQHLKSLEINQNKSSGLDENPSIQINETITTKLEKVTQIIDQVQESCINNLGVYDSKGIKSNDNNGEMLNGPPLTSTQPESSVSLYSLESHDISNIKPPSCIDEASLSLESSNFPSLEFTNTMEPTKPEPPKIISTILSTEPRGKSAFNGIDTFLESTNPPSDMEAISGLSSSCGSLNSLDSELNDFNFPIVKEFDLEATKLIKKQTEDIIQLTESHNMDEDQCSTPTTTTSTTPSINSILPKPIFQRNDTFNCDGQNESEDDSRATYICSPRRARIVKPVLRTQSTNHPNNNNNDNKIIRRFNSTSSSNSSKIASNESNKNKSLVIKGTKTTALRGNRSKSTSEGPSEQKSIGTSSSVPTTPVKKLNSTNNNDTKFSSKTYVVRKRTGSSTITNNNTSESDTNNNNTYGYKNRSLSSNKMCNSTSIHNITDKMSGNLQTSSSVSTGQSISSSTSSSALHLNKRCPVQSKIASLWKRSHAEKENVTNQSYIPAKNDNNCNKNVNNNTMSRPNKFGSSFSQIKTSPSIHPSPSTPLASSSSTSTTTSLTRSSTYEKLPSSPNEAIKMQSTTNRKENKETSTVSRVPLTKNRIRPTQDQITTTSLTNNKQSKVITLRSETKRKGSLI